MKALLFCVLFVSLIFSTSPANCAEHGNSSDDDSPDGAVVDSAPDDDAVDDRFSTEMLHAQVLLDRLMFSPGAIDGIHGQNMASALAAFQEKQELDETGELDHKTSRALVSTAMHVTAGYTAPTDASAPPGPAGAIPALTTYTITRADVAINFAKKLPDTMAKKSQLPALPYENFSEMLAERFHCTPELLARLNPDATWTEGDEVIVPNVMPTFIEIPKEKLRNDKGDRRSQQADDNGRLDRAERHKAMQSADKLTSHPEMKVEGPVTIIVSKTDTTLSVLDATGGLVFHAPVTAGSKHDPLPLGEWQVNVVEKYPVFHYNPDLFWDAEATDEEAVIPAGPNNPVGVAWIDISKPHYGLHGTPIPETIGYTESHGCVRLTNWDVKRVSNMVKPDAKVFFVETPEDRLKLADKIREKASRRHEKKSDKRETDEEGQDGGR